MSKLWKNHGLTITMFGLFIVFLIGQTLTGHQVFNQEQEDHGKELLSLWQYLGQGHFIEAVFENWESEFLQMGSYVFLTVYLFEKSSPESRQPSQPQPGQGNTASTWLRNNALGLAFLGLFIASLFLHAAGGSGESCRDEIQHAGECESMFGYMMTSQFWFESFQNWQSEFLAVGSLVVLSIFLREKGSPESK